MFKSFNRIESIPADSACIAWSQTNKSLLAPTCPPWIFNFPVSSNYSHQQDHMINIFAAVWEYSTFICKPIWSINSNWDWLFLNCSLKLITSFGCFECRNSETASSCTFATLEHGSVGILLLCADGVCLDILNHSVYYSSSTTWEATRAIQKLLLWKWF